MIKKTITILLIQFLFSPLLFSETHVGGRTEGGTWDLDGSPYIVDEDVELIDDAELIIEPGVLILFHGCTRIRGRDITIIAEGTADDSILFIPFNYEDEYPDDWSGIVFLGGNSIGRFDYCYFFCVSGFFDNSAAIYGADFLEVRHSVFRYLAIGIGPHGPNSLIEDCLFEDIAFGRPIVPCIGDSTIVRRCVFKSITYYGPATDNGVFDNCLFYNTYVIVFGEARASITNSIFLSRGGGTAIVGNAVNVSNNCFYNYAEITSEDIEGVGVLNRVNANGDSTDRFGNMILNPQLVGGEDFPDQHFLQDDSPCIDAGNPEDDPDPDGTLPDIGAFFYPQCNINVEPDTVEFIGVQIDEVVELELEIMNIGVLPLLIESWTIHPVNMPFRINDLEQEFELSPDSSRVVTISFAPLEEQRYEASLLIESNDRDEDILEIPLVGTALGVELSDEALPTEFAITGIYPNPFNSSITITYSLPVVAQTSLVIYDISGRKAAALVDSKTEQGIHKTTFNASDLATGIYFVRMRASDMVQTRKVMFIR
ncbi:MAG: T9SS type A sorting domain-containing protein [Candidatus Hatepunaea meridiana]|nr:T9SS type A sorting domain-containing protein [Candidatus Hatepunaea meridiana]